MRILSWAVLAATLGCPGVVRSQDDEDPDRKLQVVVSPYYATLPPHCVPLYLDDLVGRIVEMCRVYGGTSTAAVRYSSISGWGVVGDCSGLSTADRINFLADAETLARRIAARYSNHSSN